MQTPTHLFAGIVIQFFVLQFFPTSDWLAITLVIGLAFFSHFFLDALAKITYHPPVRESGNFWLIWHVFVYLVTFLVIVLYAQEYSIGMLAANLVDIWDWLFLRKYANYRNQPDWGKRYYLHPLADRVRQLLFNQLPNLNYSKVFIIPELLLFTGWAIIYLLTMN